MNLRVLVVDWDDRARTQTVAAVHQAHPSAEVVESPGAVDAEARLLLGEHFDLVVVEYQLVDGYGPKVADLFIAQGARAVVVSSVGALCPAAQARVVPRAEIALRLNGGLYETKLHEIGRTIGRLVQQSMALSEAPLALLRCKGGLKAEVRRPPKCADTCG